MKIIADVNGSQFIVQATDTELSRIMGYGYPTQARDKGHKIEVGKEIPVSALWEALEVTRVRVTEVANLAASLRKTADRVDAINAVLKAPIVEVKAS